jgi:putative hemolysin
MAFEIALTIFLVLLNGFFVAAEFAIVKVRASQVEARGVAGKAASAAARSILSNLDAYLAATQLGITLASLGLGWVGEDVFTNLILRAVAAFGGNITPDLAHRIAVPVAFAIITVLHITFGELAPKSLAIRKPLATTMAVALPMRVFYFVFRPAIWMLNGLANTLLRIFGIKPMAEHDIHSEEELRMIVSESHEGGVLEDTEREIIHNAFDLGERKIASLMTPRADIIWLDLHDDREITKQKMTDFRHHVYPLCEDDLDNVVGYVYAKDLVTENFDEALDRLEKMKRPPLYVPENNTAYRVLERFKETKIHQALVVDEFGSVKGLVTINDIFDALVGDISEENEFEYEVVRREDGSMLVDAQIPFEDFLEVIGDEDEDDRPQGDYVTLGGYIVECLKRIPQEGDTCRMDSWTIEVVDMDRSRIDKVLIRQTEVQEGEEGEEE